MMKRTSLVSLIIFLTAHLGWGQTFTRLLKENAYYSARNSVEACRFMTVGHELYFNAFEDSTGYELWKTDGTPAGTKIVKNILPGARFPARPLSTPQSVYNGALYFITNDSVHGAELWTTDGTAAGTHMVKNIDTHNDNNRSYPCRTDYEPGFITIYHGLMYFFDSDSVHGGQLYRSDGTDSGTYMIKDITNNLNIGSYCDNDAASNGNSPLHTQRYFILSGSLMALTLSAQ